MTTHIESLPPPPPPPPSEAAPEVEASSPHRVKSAPSSAPLLTRKRHQRQYREGHLRPKQSSFKQGKSTSGLFLDGRGIVCTESMATATCSKNGMYLNDTSNRSTGTATTADSASINRPDFVNSTCGASEMSLSGIFAAATTTALRRHRTTGDVELSIDESAHGWGLELKEFNADRATKIFLKEERQRQY